MDGATLLVLLLAAIAAVIAWISYNVMESQREILRDQTALLKRQLDIVEVQNKIVLEEFERKADLVWDIRFDRIDFESNTCEILVFTRNKGRKSAGNYFWSFGIELTVAETIQIADESTSRIEAQGHTTIGDVSIHLGRGEARGPLYPARRAIACTVRLENFLRTGTYRIATKLVYEDGIKPPGDRNYTITTFDMTAFLAGTAVGIET